MHEVHTPAVKTQRAAMASKVSTHASRYTCAPADASCGLLQAPSSASQRVVLRCIALAPQTTEEDLAAVFGLHGRVHNVNIPPPERVRIQRSIWYICIQSSNFIICFEQPTRGARMAFICMTPNIDGEDVIRNLQSMVSNVGFCINIEQQLKRKER